ncbi:hypothetical protein [Pseudanabaena sp. PCC 6802]|uniref:hypothetical protein n=1 Tax=Pseudanabaena sp. PCC 6802 TaxID=118173 RepID=UPI000348E482|nr:hypothetical protein [Pseudanabaena sp. PCC 6802]
MASISISNLQSSSSALFANEENFMSEIPEDKLSSVTGGLSLQDAIDNIIRSIGEALSNSARGG